MQAAYHPITIEQGATSILKMTWKDGAGIPVSLIGYTARLQVRRDIDSPVQLELTLGDGISLGGATGRIELEFASTKTSAISIDSTELRILNGRSQQAMLYDLVLTSADGRVTRLLQGPAHIYPSVTR